MFDWVQLAILLLKFANAIVNWAHDRGMINEGRRQVLAESALNIAVKAKNRDEIREKIDAMSEAEVDAQLGGLVDPPAGRSKPMHT